MVKKEKKKCVFLAYFLETMNLSRIYLSFGQIQQQKYQNLCKNSDSQTWEGKIIFPTIYSVLVVWIKISP